MTTVLLIGVLVWMVGVECRLWVNIHRLNEHLEELHQDMEGRAPFEILPLVRLGS
jgi:hypothetical protein